MDHREAKAVQINRLGGGVWNCGSCGERPAKENNSKMLSIVSAATESQVIGKTTADPHKAQWQIAARSVSGPSSGRVVLVATCDPDTAVHMSM